MWQKNATLAVATTSTCWEARNDNRDGKASFDLGGIAQGVGRLD
jgi:hypothetical protein